MPLKLCFLQENELNDNFLFYCLKSVNDTHTGEKSDASGSYRDLRALCRLSFCLHCLHTPFTTTAILLPVGCSMAPSVSPKLSHLALLMSPFFSYKLITGRGHSLPSSATDPSTQLVDRFLTHTQ